jgi:hypothetical protein
MVATRVFFDLQRLSSYSLSNNQVMSSGGQQARLGGWSRGGRVYRMDL